jgi:hypothetical protein
MEIVLVLLLIAAAAIFFLYRSGSGENSSDKRLLPKSNVPMQGQRAEKRVRLTNQQIIVLSSASLDKPIYGENPSMLYVQMPSGASCFNLRTIESLVKRGYLQADGKGGYLLTPEGIEGLRSGMGF